MARESMVDKIKKKTLIKQSNIAKTNKEIKILIKIIEQLKKMSNLNQSTAATSCSEMNSTASIYDDINPNNIGIQYASNKTAKSPYKDNSKIFDDKRQSQLLKPNCQSTNGTIKMQDISNQIVCEEVEPNSKIGDHLRIADEVVIYNNNNNNDNVLANDYYESSDVIPGPIQPDLDLINFLQKDGQVDIDVDLIMYADDINNELQQTLPVTNCINYGSMNSQLSPGQHNYLNNSSYSSPVSSDADQQTFTPSHFNNEEKTVSNQEFDVDSSMYADDNINNGSQQVLPVINSRNEDLMNPEFTFDLSSSPGQHYNFNNSCNISPVTSDVDQQSFDFISSLNAEQSNSDPQIVIHNSNIALENALQDYNNSPRVALLNTGHSQNSILQVVLSPLSGQYENISDITIFITNMSTPANIVATEEEWHISDEDYEKISWINELVP